MRDVLGPVGAWAPRAEQVATARLLDNEAQRRPWQQSFRANIHERLQALYAGFQALANEGLPVAAVEPQGAIYLSVRFDLVGKQFATNEELRHHLLEAAGAAMVPFQAFGLPAETGWFRLSAGAVSLREIEAMFPRLSAALRG
jgi:aspartate aminotransferase